MLYRLLHKREYAQVTYHPGSSHEVYWGCKTKSILKGGRFQSMGVKHSMAVKLYMPYSVFEIAQRLCERVF